MPTMAMSNPPEADRFLACLQRASRLLLKTKADEKLSYICTKSLGFLFYSSLR